MSNEVEQKEYNEWTFKPELGSSYKQKLRKIETPNTIVTINGGGFKFEQSIEDVKFNKRKENRAKGKEIINDETLDMKIIKNPVDQNDKNKRAIQIHHISTKRTTYKSKYNKNNQNLKPKSKPKEYNGKLGLFKSDIPTPYKPIPTNYPFKINNDIKINDASMENQSNQPIETRPSEASRNKDVENIRGQVHTSVTEGDEVLFKSMSSTEEFNKEESSNNHQDDSTHRLKQAQDLLDSTKRRIDEIEKDLKKVNYIDNTIKEDDLTPKQTIKVPPLKKEQIAKIKGEIFENLQLDKSK